MGPFAVLMTIIVVLRKIVKSRRRIALEGQKYITNIFNVLIELNVRPSYGKGIAGT